MSANTVDKLLNKLWHKIRPIPKRIYKYGTVGLFCHDDRTLLEKVCDFVDKLLEVSRGTIKDNSVWHTFYDTSTGKVISSYSQMRDIERKDGISYLTFREAEEQFARNREHINKETKKQRRKRLEKRFIDLKQGKYRRIVGNC